ncbi:MAG: YitT family protein [Clostridia bacterium]|nr:YitT family protein [Clostridia bacterium]
MNKRIKEFLLINLGLILVALGVYLFKIPNSFATGGVSGLAIVANKFFPGLTIGPLMMVINIVLIIIGLIFLGFDFGSKTIYSSFALSGLVWFFEKVFPITKPLTGDTLLELIFSIMLPAIGSAIVFNQDASTGGTDIVAKILNKLTHINIGKTLLIADFSITIAAGLVFGIKVGMYSLLGLIMKAFIIDIVIESMNICKQVVIISEKSHEIKEYIINNLQRGATVYKATGAFTSDEKEVISTILNRKQAIKLRSYIRSIDSKAFITISNTSEIIGKGFRNTGL